MTPSIHLVPLLLTLTPHFSYLVPYPWFLLQNLSFLNLHPTSLIPRHFLYTLSLLDDHFALLPHPTTLNHLPLVLNPQSSPTSLNHQSISSSSNLKPQFSNLNPPPCTLLPSASTLDPKPSIFNPPPSSILFHILKISSLIPLNSLLTPHHSYLLFNASK